MSAFAKPVPVEKDRLEQSMDSVLVQTDEHDGALLVAHIECDNDGVSRRRADVHENIWVIADTDLRSIAQGRV